jgi:hypothetical protein
MEATSLAGKDLAHDYAVAKDIGFEVVHLI